MKCPFIVFLVFSSLLVPQVTHRTHVAALQIAGSHTSVQVVNGAMKNLHTVTFMADEYDADSPQEFTATDTSGTTRRVTVQAQPPELHYSLSLDGSIPKFMQPVSSRVCMTTLPTNTSMLQQDSGRVYDSPVAQNFDEVVNGAKRRLLAHRAKYGPPGAAPWVPSRREVEYQDYIKRDVAHRLNRQLLSKFGNMRGNLINQFALAYGVTKYLVPSLWKAGVKIRKVRSARSAVKKAEARKAEAEAPTETDMTKVGGSTESPQLTEDALNSQTSALESGAASESAVAASDTAVSAEVAATAEESTLLIGTEGLATGLLGAGAVLVAGMAISWGLSELFGGSGNGNKALAEALHAIATEVNDIARQVDTLTKVAQQEQQFQATVNNRFAVQDQINQHLQNEVNNNAEAIAHLELAVDRVGKAINAVENQTIADFNAVGQQLQSEAYSTSVLWNVTKQFHKEAESQFRLLIKQVSKLAWNTRTTSVNMVHMWRDTSMRRAIIKLYHRTAELELAQPSVPLLGFQGTPPIGLTEYNKLKTPEGAFSFGSVIIQRTIQNGDYYAQLFNLTYLCDPLYVLDNVISGMDFQTVFQWLGPSNCLSSHESLPWNCTCVFKVESQQCELQPGLGLHAYPWKWGGATSMEPGPSPVDHDSMTEHCTSTTPTAVPASSVAAGVTPGQFTDGPSVYPTGYLHTIPEVQNWLTGFCEDSLTVPDPVSGAKVRIHGSLWPRYLDLALDSSADPDVCNSNFAQMFSKDNTQNWMAFAVYRVLTRNYLSNLDVHLANLEQRVYGHIASDLTFTEEPFNSESANGQTHRCTGFNYLRINPYNLGDCTDTVDPSPSCTKVKMYTGRFTSRKGRLIVKVDGVPITNSSAETGSYQATQAYIHSIINTTVAGEVATMTSKLNMDIEGQNVLPALFHKLGPVPGRADGNGNLAVYDVPFELLSAAPTATSRIGKLNYFMMPWSLEQYQTYGYDEPFSVQKWKQWYQMNFDSRFAAGSPHNFKRKLTANPNPINADLSAVDYFCDESYESDGVTLSDKKIYNNEWCQIMRWYTVEPVNGNGNKWDGQTGLIFRPRSYLYEATLQVPGGPLVQNLTSHCPHAIHVTVNPDGSSQVVLNSSVAGPVSFQVVIQNRTLNPDCTITLGTQSYYKHNPFIFTVPYDEACHPRYIQVFTLNNNEACFPQPGKPAGTTYISYGGNTPPDVEHAVSHLRDETVQDIVEQSNNAINIANEVQRISNEAVDTDDINRQMQTLEDTATQSIISMRTRGDVSHQHVDEQISKMKQDLQKERDRIIAERTEAKSVNKLIQQMHSINAFAENLTDVVLARLVARAVSENAKTQADLGPFNKAIDNAIDALDKEDSGCGGGGFMGKLLAPLCKLWHWITHGVGQLIKTILMVVLFIGILICLFECLPGCCSGMCGMCSSIGASAGSMGKRGKHVERSRNNRDGSEFSDDSDEELVPDRGQKMKPTQPPSPTPVESSGRAKTMKRKVRAPSRKTLNGRGWYDTNDDTQY